MSESRCWVMGALVCVFLLLVVLVVTGWLRFGWGQERPAPFPAPPANTKTI